MLLFLFWFGLALSTMAPVGALPNKKDISLPGCTTFNNRFYKYVATPKTWADAELHCVSEGANLVSIHTKEEQEFVASLIQSTDLNLGYTWIGLSDAHKEGVWMWSDGSKVDFVFWSKYQPDNYNGAEHCIHTHGNSEGTWNDELCSRKHAFVCVTRI